MVRITRMLIQRIFNDPAFGIHAMVDSILSPPMSPLSLADYLSAMFSVREKLTALYHTLLEYCVFTKSSSSFSTESKTLKKQYNQSPQKKMNKNSNY